jgi:hypothetical protein
MSTMDALENGMEDFVEFGDPDAQRVVDALHAYIQAPDSEITSAHLAAIATETGRLRHAADGARRSANRLQRRSTGTFRLTRRRLAVVPAALMLAFFVTAGLAAAGLTLPDAARAPFDAVGVHLPNQSRASDQSSAGDVHTVIDSSQPGDRCGFGHTVAATASQGRSHAPASACDHVQGDHHQIAAQSQGAAQSNATDEGTQSQNSATSQPSGVPPTPPAGQEFGQSSAADAQQNASTDGRAFGERTSEGARDLTPATPPTSAGQGVETGQSHAGQGKATAAGSPGAPHVP